MDDPDTAAVFHGYDGYVGIPNHPEINTGVPSAERPVVFSHRTVELWFRADDVDTRQVLYEQGGWPGGLNIFLDSGLLYVNGWNVVDDDETTPWGPRYVSAGVSPGIVYHVALVYDQSEGRITGYLNGDAFGEITDVGRIFRHCEATAIGANRSSTFFDWYSNEKSCFSGVIDEVALYNAALSPVQIQDHYQAGVAAGHVLPSGATIDPATGLIAWNPTDDDVGTHSVSVQVTDGRGGVATQTFSIDVQPMPANSPPMILSEPVTRALVDQGYVYRPTVVDFENDVLRYELTTTAVGMVLDPDTGTLTWNPTNQDVGLFPVTVRVEDGRGGWDAQSFTVEVVLPTPNVSPVITSTPLLAAAVDRVYAYPVTATDPDEDPLRFALTVSPAGMEIDAVTGLLSWTPSAAQLGVNSVTVRVDDGRDGEATQSFEIVVQEVLQNRSPQVISSPPTTGVVGERYHYVAAATDADSDSLLFDLPLHRSAWPSTRQPERSAGCPRRPSWGSTM